MGRPLCIDLFCGLGGWAEGFLSEGYDVVGFDIERHDYGTGGYPGQLVLQDVLTLHGSQFREAACIVASPPCQRYSWMAMPWRQAKVEGAWQRWFRDSGSPFADPFTLNTLWDACFRIQQEASAEAKRHIPLVVENVKGAQPWVGRAKWHYGSYYLWGDVPALMPFTFQARKNSGGSWFAQAHNTESGHSRNPVTGEKLAQAGTKQNGSGPEWFDRGVAHLPSASPRRKAASAQIAKIPFPLAQHIARVFHEG
jgi:hypothetical protein